MNSKKILYEFTFTDNTGSSLEDGIEHSLIPSLKEEAHLQKWAPGWELKLISGPNVSEYEEGDEVSYEFNVVGEHLDE